MKKIILPPLAAGIVLVTIFMCLGASTLPSTRGVYVNGTNGAVISPTNLVLPVYNAAVIPTNAITPGSASATNWVLVSLGGIPTLIATNRVDGGWLTKALYP